MNNAPIKGYGGKMLGVDLSRGRVTEQLLDEATLRNYVGGTCLGIKFLYDRVRPGVQWNDPQNCLLLLSGPFGGTRIGGSGNFSVVTKGPLTNGVAASQANGLFGAFLRFCGFDGIVVEGVSQNWTYLYIQDGAAELRDAQLLVGKDTWETDDLLKKELGHSDSSLSVACIGPAGENLVKFAAIVSDKGHIAAHNGVGAVMGSKRLKAIAVARGKQRVQVSDPGTLSATAAEFLESVKHTAKFEWGTLGGIFALHKIGILPVKNYTTGVWDVDADTLAKFREENIRNSFPELRRKPCWACQFHHSTILTIKEGKYAGEVLEEPDYEPMSAMGPVLGNKDIATALKLAHEVDRLGMDGNESGWVVGLVMECFEKGIITAKDTDGLQMTWGNGDATLQLLGSISRRQGFGNTMAEGVMRAARKIGGQAPNFAVHSMKGNTPRTHDHRAQWQELFDTCVSNLGTLEHNHLISLKQFGIPRGDEYDPEYISMVEAKTKGAMLFEDSMGVCRWNTVSDINRLCKALNAATGWNVDMEEALRIGRRATNLARVFNISHGISSDLDRPSPRYGSTPIDGRAKGKSSSVVWQQMLNNYYALMGWDESGKPRPETLRGLGLESVIDDLESH